MSDVLWDRLCCKLKNSSGSLSRYARSCCKFLKKIPGFICQVRLRFALDLVKFHQSAACFNQQADHPDSPSQVWQTNFLSSRLGTLVSVQHMMLLLSDTLCDSSPSLIPKEKQPQRGYVSFSGLTSWGTGCKLDRQSSQWQYQFLQLLSLAVLCYFVCYI